MVDFCRKGTWSWFFLKVLSKNKNKLLRKLKNRPWQKILILRFFLGFLEGVLIFFFYWLVKVRSKVKSSKSRKAQKIKSRLVFKKWALVFKKWSRKNKKFQSQKASPWSIFLKIEYWSQRQNQKSNNHNF